MKNIDCYNICTFNFFYGVRSYLNKNLIDIENENLQEVKEVIDMLKLCSDNDVIGLILQYVQYFKPTFDRYHTEQYAKNFKLFMASKIFNCNSKINKLCQINIKQWNYMTNYRRFIYKHQSLDPKYRKKLKRRMRFYEQLSLINLLKCIFTHKLGNPIYIEMHKFPSSWKDIFIFNFQWFFEINNINASAQHFETYYFQKCIEFDVLHIVKRLLYLMNCQSQGFSQMNLYRLYSDFIMPLNARNNTMH